jgi:DNA adenine methylase
MNNRVKPFVKWAGGKGSLLSQISKYYPDELKNGRIDKYVEPFVGGGAVLINILQDYHVKEAYAFDINMDLMNSYNVIKFNVDKLIHKLKKKEDEYIKLDFESRKKYYYDVREKYNSYIIKENELSIERAEEFIFLNRTCFNGLYRVNKSGKFNVPMGKYKNPTICDESNLNALSKLIENVKFEYGSYTNSNFYADENTFIYFDPPYRPLNVTSGFTSYTKEDFNDENQKELALFYTSVHSKNSKLMLSNSNPKNTNQEDTFFEDIYSEFNINEVYARRMINANSKGRGEISELLITNYNNIQ